MSTLTKEWLLTTIAELEEERDAVPAVVNEDAAMSLAAMKLALASLEAEPVYQVLVDGSWTDYDKQHLEELLEAKPSTLFRVAYPSPRIMNPVSVDADDNFYSWFGREWHEHYQHNQYTTAAKQMLGVMAESAWKAGRRAAMLQGAERVSNRDELPDGWVACSERMPERDYVMAADFTGKQYPANLPNIQIGIYADWFDDGCPCWDDGDGNDLHLKQVTHWAQIPAAPQQEVK